MYDLLFRNAKIVDGSGDLAYTADVAITGDRIVKIGRLEDAEVKRIINLEGKVLAPGFIDMHSHSDTVILAYPQMESMLYQGITTFVGCQCGHSIAPVGRLWEASQAFYDLQCKISDKLYPDMYADDYYVPSEKAIELIEKEWGFRPDWASMGEFLDEVDKKGLSGNIITLSGYNTLRMNAADPDQPSKLGEEQKRWLKNQIHKDIEGGAFGMSTGLDYKPGVFTDTAELMDMASVLKTYDGIYFSHWRKTGQRTGTPKRQKKIEGIKEVLEIGMVNGIQVQISHISSGFDVFPAYDKYMQNVAAIRTLQVVDEYIDRGARAYMDVIPNIYGGTILAPDLMSLFRPWYMFSGGIIPFAKQLAYPDFRKPIIDTINKGQFFRLNPVANPDWDENFTVIRAKDGNLVGRTIQDIAAKRKVCSLDTLFDLLQEDPKIKVFSTSYGMTKQSVQTFLNHPRAAVGNDTFVYNMTSTMGYDPEFPNKRPSPNTYCGFIKFLTEFGMPRLEDSIYKLSGLPAKILRLSDRGIIKEGFRADVVALDYNNLRTNENLIDTMVYPTGVEYVAVNGTLVIDNGQHTGQKPGGSIRFYNK